MLAQLGQGTHASPRFEQVLMNTLQSDSFSRPLLSKIKTAPSTSVNKLTDERDQSFYKN